MTNWADGGVDLAEPFGCTPVARGSRNGAITGSVDHVSQDASLLLQEAGSRLNRREDPAVFFARRTSRAQLLTQMAKRCLENVTASDTNDDWGG
jgi:hypothetical protein